IKKKLVSNLMYVTNEENDIEEPLDYVNDGGDNAEEQINVNKEGNFEKIEQYFGNMRELTKEDLTEESLNKLKELPVEERVKVEKAITSNREGLPIVYVDNQNHE